MASSFFMLFDDIAAVLDDVAVMTKVAVKKTAGVLGDDLALNAQQVTGVQADRELPVVWAVAKGSFWNKAVLVPTALLISAFAPMLITPLLMVGGLYLCFEGFEKVAHRFSPNHATENAAHHAKHTAALGDTASDLVQLERGKIKGAIRTDFVLSAEIIVIALGTVASAGLGQQIGVLVGISLLMTVGVYGLVAGIIKLDDTGLYLQQSRAAVWRKVGSGLLWFAPQLLKLLSIVGTVAMFMVGGSILAHGLPWLQGVMWPWFMPSTVVETIVGLIAGGAALVIFKLMSKCFSK